MAWSLTTDAQDDLTRHTDLGAMRHGVDRSLDYALKLLGAIDDMAQNPYVYQERAVSNGTVRLMIYMAHNILFEIDNEDVLVLRILHSSEDWIYKL